ncbi:MAG: NACHT domain-containing NTPase [Cyanobacteria bacterium P01_A01_bin.123]
MQLLPRDFLSKVAREYELTALEEEAFVARFNSDITDQVLIKNLNITLSAFRTRMSNVYRKLGYSGGGPGKQHRVSYFLIDKHRKENPSIPVKINDEDIDKLVEEIHEKIKPGIQHMCGWMRVLDMNQPIELANIYTDVNILEKVSRTQNLEISDLMREFDPESKDFDRLGLSRKSVERVSGIELVKNCSKLMILGKPGSGKTTFLKHIANQCNNRKLFSNLVPVFISLRNFSDPGNSFSLLEYLIAWFEKFGIQDFEVDSLLQKNRILLLLDGLDEVNEERFKYTLRQVREFTDKNFENHFIITCRLGAQDYVFEKFTEVEISDFNDEQISSFVHNWFGYKGVAEKADRFLDKIQKNTPIKDLASNPLLLTLLCLVFEDRTDFPLNRAEIYEQGLSTLLRKWDASRDIERDWVYKELSAHRKEDLLSQIAIRSFGKSEYFFKEKVLENYIADYIINLPNGRNKRFVRESDLNSKGVLKAIEYQHGLFVERARGIYSFSHLTFQEYFTARAIIADGGSERFDELVNEIFHKRWREVFLLAVSMAQNADKIFSLMKQKIDAHLSIDQYVQGFLEWVEQKSATVKSPPPAHLVRVFYFTHGSSGHSPPVIQEGLNFDLDYDENLILILTLADLISQNFDQVDSFSLFKKRDQVRTKIMGCFQSLKNVLDRSIDSSPNAALKAKLQDLASDLPYAKDLQDWWYRDSKIWIEELRSALVEYRNIGHDWHFTDAQISALQKYYDANKTLMDCLNSDCYVSRSLRKRIQNTLFLPVAKSPH